MGTHMTCSAKTNDIQKTTTFLQISQSRALLGGHPPVAGRDGCQDEGCRSHGARPRVNGAKRREAKQSCSVRDVTHSVRLLPNFFRFAGAVDLLAPLPHHVRCDARCRRPETEWETAVACSCLEAILQTDAPARVLELPVPPAVHPAKFASTMTGFHFSLQGAPAVSGACGTGTTPRFPGGPGISSVSRLAQS